MERPLIRLDRAGRLVSGHALVWVRYLPASVADVWPQISTKAGLSQWWIVAPTVFDLRPGGAFNHHWDQSITAYEKFSYIDISEAATYRGTGGMRFELEAVGPDETAFLFFDTWGPECVPPNKTNGRSSVYDTQPAGPGSPWPSVAAGWHLMVDQLERQFSDEVPAHASNDLYDFYVDYLSNQFRLFEMVQRLPAKEQ